MFELRIRAGQGLRDLGDPWTLEALAGKLDSAADFRFSISFQALLMQNPLQAWDRIRPMIAEPSERAGALLEKALYVLFCDNNDDGKPHWGAARGWFDADPRWFALCLAWREPPTPRVRAPWGGEHSQKIFEMAAWFRKRAKL